MAEIESDEVDVDSIPRAKPSAEFHVQANWVPVGGHKEDENQWTVDHCKPNL